MTDYLTHAWVRLSEWTWTPSGGALILALLVGIPALSAALIWAECAWADRRSRREAERIAEHEERLRRWALLVRAEAEWLDRLDAAGIDRELAR